MTSSFTLNFALGVPGGRIAYGSRLGAGHAHDRPGLKTRDFLELGVDPELLLEGHLPVADHEETGREQDEPAQHEHADANHSRRTGHLPASL